MVVVAAGRGFDGFEVLAAVGRAIHGRVHNVDDIGIARVRGNATEIPAALPHAVVRRNAAPILACVVRTIDAAVMRVYDRVDAIAVLSRRDGDADAAQAFAGKTLASKLLPGDPGVRGFVQAAARAVGWSIDAPRRTAGLPERGVDDCGVRSVPAQINRAGIVIYRKGFCPSGAAIGGTVHAAF